MAQPVSENSSSTESMVTVLWHVFGPQNWVVAIGLTVGVVAVLIVMAVLTWV